MLPHHQFIGSKCNDKIIPTSAIGDGFRKSVKYRIHYRGTLQISTLDGLMITGEVKVLAIVVAVA